LFDPLKAERTKLIIKLLVHARRINMHLVLFDIDGTLISSDGAAKYELNNGSDNKFASAWENVFGKSISLDFAIFKGEMDKKILLHIAQTENIPLTEFNQKFPILVKYMTEYFLAQPKDLALYQKIKAAGALVTVLYANPEYKIGVLTGNIPAIADWKLKQAKVSQYFDFGLYGNEAIDRLSLAKLVFERAKTHFGVTFQPTDITVIGDTVNDVICGKAIGAHTIAVTDQGIEAENAILAKNPDLLVKSLGDSKVAEFFHLSLI
jgi:phosphoglycolate phosphatase